MRWRIAHLLDAPFGTSNANGVAEAVRHIARAQADLGLSVAVFSSVDGAHLLGEQHAAGRPVSDVIAWTPDIVHCHSVHVLRHVVAGARARNAGIAYCVTTHGGLHPAALQRGHLKKTVFRLLLERRFLWHASFVHALTPHEVSAIRGYGFEGPIVTVPNAVPPGDELPRDTETLYSSYPLLRGRQVFMFIGRLDPWQKGLDMLIEAFSHAAPQHAVLVLVGPDHRGSRSTLERLAQQRGVQARVVFTGALFGEDRKRLFAAADVFVHPSRWEGLSLSVLAAAAAGKPCLLTHEADPLGSLEHAHAAVVVRPTTTDIAAGIQRLGSLSCGEMEAMGARARRVADAHLTWHQAAERLLRAYEDALRMTRSSAFA